MNTQKNVYLKSLWIEAIKKSIKAPHLYQSNKLVKMNKSSFLISNELRIINKISQLGFLIIDYNGVLKKYPNQFHRAYIEGFMEYKKAYYLIYYLSTLSNKIGFIKNLFYEQKSVNKCLYKIPLSFENKKLTFSKKNVVSVNETIKLIQIAGLEKLISQTEKSMQLVYVCFYEPMWNQFGTDLFEMIIALLAKL